MEICPFESNTFISKEKMEELFGFFEKCLKRINILWIDANIIGNQKSVNMLKDQLKMEKYEININLATSVDEGYKILWNNLDNNQSDQINNRKEDKKNDNKEYKNEIIKTGRKYIFYFVNSCCKAVIIKI